MALSASTYTFGRDGRFGPTPFRNGWWATVASASAPRAGAAPAAFNPFSPRLAAPAPAAAAAPLAAAERTARPSPLALAVSLELASPRAPAGARAPPGARAPFSPGRTLAEQAADAGGPQSWRSLTDHFKARPSPTH